ncbi:putative DNA-binding domain-containing protein [Shimia sp. R9_2]|uniref:HvfC/BufC N-terminal domain-containing protein n=1 Tax=Shimia sp. R9_2 TaxID=2821112 RepID=UPI001ADBA692|nr:DNA-binding domain-containing protein [Shimia sp. R9_2]MBO9396078.1 putative DNA-binding domain-containing protein [Shimia sp. R9_2]
MNVSQNEFRGAIFDGGRARPEGLSDAKGQPAGRRFDVYRNNVAVSLTEALATGFPTIAKLIGSENFNAIAGVFLRQSPPSSPMMMHYGEDFPDFLAGFEPLAHLGYLADVARLEMAMRRSYHAADAEAVNPEALAAHPPERLTELVMTFAPSVKLLRSPWPIHAIWAFNMQDGPKPEAGGQDVIILRPEYDPVPHALAPGAYEFITALTAGGTLGAAAAVATDEVAEFDLSATLGLLLTGNALISIDLPS